MLSFSEQQGPMQAAHQRQLNQQNESLLRLLQYSLSFKKNCNKFYTEQAEVKNSIV